MADDLGALRARITNLSQKIERAKGQRDAWSAQRADLVEQLDQEGVSEADLSAVIERLAGEIRAALKGITLEISQLEELLHD